MCPSLADQLGSEVAQGSLDQVWWQLVGFPLALSECWVPFQHLFRHLWDTPTHHTHLISEGWKYLQPT